MTVIFLSSELCFLQLIKCSASLKVWVLTVDNRDIKRYTCTEVMCEFAPQ